MKKIFCLIALACMTFAAWADTSPDCPYILFEWDNGFYYISGCTNNIAGEVVIPKVISTTEHPNAEIAGIKETGAIFNSASITNNFSLVINAEILRIPDNTFNGAIKLTSITLPETVNTLGSGAFDNCTALTKIIFRNSAAPTYVYGNVFHREEAPYYNTNLTVVVPEGSTNAYKTAHLSESDAGTYNQVMNNNTIIEAAKIKISNVGYATYYTSAGSYSLPAGVTAQIVTAAGASSLTLGDAFSEVQKSCAVLINGPEGTYMCELNTSGTAFSGTNLLHGTDAQTPISGEGYKYYKLANGASGLGWYYDGANNTTGATLTNHAHKAYLAIPNVGGAPERPFIPLVSDTTTDIETIENGAITTQKRFVNGRLLIIRDGVTYDVTGNVVR